MPEQPLPPILYWSPSLAAHTDASETFPGVVVDTASAHGLVLAALNGDDWHVLSAVPDDAVRLVAGPPRAVRPDPLGVVLGLIEHARDDAEGADEGHIREGLDQALEIVRDQVRAPAQLPAKDGDADELLLVRDDERVSGRATIGHTRLPAGVIVRLLLGGAPHDAIRESYPDVTPEQLRVLGELLVDERVVADPELAELAAAARELLHLVDEHPEDMPDLGPVLARIRAAVPDPDGAEPVQLPDSRWVLCARIGCPEWVDRHLAHVVVERQVERLSADGHGSAVLEAPRVLTVLHTECAPDRWAELVAATVRT